MALNTAYAKAQGAYEYNGAGYWWPRSPGNAAYDAAFVNYDGSFDSYGSLVSYDHVGVRPAFNLNLNSVLFTSAAVGGKSFAAGSGGNPSGAAANAIFEIDDYDGSDGWKLTVLDDYHKSFNISDPKINGSGSTIAFSYSGAQTGTNEYISAVVVDNNGAITHYGRISQPASESGTASVTLP